MIILDDDDVAVIHFGPLATASKSRDCVWLHRKYRSQNNNSTELLNRQQTSSESIVLRL